MIVTATRDGGETCTIESGLIISVWVMATAMTVGLIATMLGYERGMAHAATFIGLTTTGVGGIWVGYIIYDLYRSLSNPKRPQSELRDREEQS